MGLVEGKSCDGRWPQFRRLLRRGIGYGRAEFRLSEARCRDVQVVVALPNAGIGGTA